MQDNPSEVKQTETKVTVHLPEKVNGVIRQQKINRIYDLLKPKSEKIIS